MLSVPCSHLEKLLPQMRDGKLPRADSSGVTFDVFKTPQYDLEEFKSLLRNYGFVQEWDISLLVAKYFYRMTHAAIVEEFNYTNKMLVTRRLKELRRLLVERGFAQELE